MNEENPEINLGKLMERVDNVLRAVNRLEERFDKMSDHYATVEKVTRLEKDIESLSSKIWMAVSAVILAFINSVFEFIKIK